MDVEHRVGDAASDRDGRTSSRRPALVALVVTVLVLGFVGSSMMTDGFDDYRSTNCKGVAIAEPIVDSALPAAQRPALPPTPPHAIATFARAQVRTMYGDPFPTDRWHEDRGRWVRDMPDGTFLELGVREAAGGWFVTTSSVCSR